MLDYQDLLCFKPVYYYSWKKDSKSSSKYIPKMLSTSWMFCTMWWKCFSTDGRHSDGNKLKLCSALRSPIPSLLWGWLARTFDLSFRYMDDILPFGNFVQLIYPKGLGIKVTTITMKSASYLDIYLYKCDNVSSRIVNFPFICGNIPSAPAYGLFI